MNFSPPQLALIAAESALVLFGLVQGIRILKSRAQTKNSASRILSESAPKSIQPWSATWFHFAQFSWYIIACGFIGQVAAIEGLKFTEFPLEAKQIIAGALFQLGMLAGLMVFAWRSSAGKDYPLPKKGFFLAGFQCFAITLPLVLLSGIAWTSILEFCGIPVQRQELVDLFADTKSPLQIGVMVFFATIIAPVTEELIFRAGIYRFLRTRTSPIVAVIIPSLLFAALHGNLASFTQLFVLGAVFSIAYEHTDNIGVPIFAHTCFNANTILLLLAGIDA